MHTLSQVSFEVEEFEITSPLDPFARQAFDVLSTDILPDDYTMADFLDRISGQTCLGAINSDAAIDEALLGIATLDLRAPDAQVPFFNAAFFDMLATRPDLKEAHGIGTALAWTAIDYAAQAGFSNIYGIIENDSPTFHERFGYQERFFGNHLYMVKPL